MKKNIQIIILILSILIGIVIISNWWLNRYFFRAGDDYPPELFDFKPEKLQYNADRPIFFYCNDSLYYGGKGDIDLNNKPIWVKHINTGGGSEHGIFISPNSEFVAFNENNDKIIIIDKAGNLIHTIVTIDKTIPVDATFWGKELQWNENSTKLYFTQYRKWEKFLSKNNRSTLYDYSITDISVH